MLEEKDNELRSRPVVTVQQLGLTLIKCQD